MLCMFCACELGYDVFHKTWLKEDRWDKRTFIGE